MENRDDPNENMVRSARILRRLFVTRGDYCHSDFRERPANAGMKNYKEYNDIDNNSVKKKEEDSPVLKIASIPRNVDSKRKTGYSDQKTTQNYNKEKTNGTKNL